MPGVGPAVARLALDLLSGAQPDFSALAAFAAPAAAKDCWSQFTTLMHELARSREWKAEIERLRKWYDPLLAARYDNAHTRLGDLDQLERIATRHATRVAFLTDLALDPPEAAGAQAGPPLKDEDWLILSTIHSAKGQEWRAVYVLNVVDGCIPSDLATGTTAEIEEERRLLYVAMTRARDDLVLMQPMRYYVRGQRVGSDPHVYAPRSRFITDADVAAFDIVAPPAASTAVNDDVNGPRVDLKSAMRRMWTS
jgi:DNA helicase-2/ATP-dependent DNA helicase PcrA